MSTFTDLAIHMLNDGYENYDSDNDYEEALKWLDTTFYCSKNSVGYGLIKDWFIESLEDYGHGETMSKWMEECLQESIDVEEIEKTIIKIREDIELNLEYKSVSEKA